MSNSNRRNKNYETVHHLVSRIAHRVYFLKETERMDFLEIVRRAASFTGIQLVGWCVMSNHFHLLVYLPALCTVDEAEVLRRYGILKGISAAESMASTLAVWRKNGESGEKRAEEWLNSQRARMYDVGSFMKIIKQWFTQDYNKRNSHKGTLWEAVYHDRVVPASGLEIAKCLGYIHLNPLRAALTDRFDGYEWSSYCAFKKGDPIAASGMRFAYGNDLGDGEIADAHECLLESLLTSEKLRIAEEIARKRLAGCEAPLDPLTTEAMVVQQTAHVAEVQKELAELHSASMEETGRSARRLLREHEALSWLKANPEMDIPSLAKKMGIGLSTAYAAVRRLKKSTYWDSPSNFRRLAN